MYIPFISLIAPCAKTKMTFRYMTIKCLLEIIAYDLSNYIIEHHIHISSMYIREPIITKRCYCVILFFSLGAVNLTMRVLYISLLVAFSVTLIAPGTEANFFKWIKKTVKDVGTFIDKNAKEICKVGINTNLQLFQIIKNIFIYTTLSTLA